MKKYRFLVHHAEYVDFLEDLRRLGVLHVRYQAVEPSEELQQELERRKSIRETLRALRHRGVEPREEEGNVEAEEGLEIVFAHRQLTDRLEKQQQALNALQKEINFWEPWGDFSPDAVRRLEDAGLSVRFFISPVKRFRPEWKNDYSLEVIRAQPPDCYFVVITSGEEEVTIDAEEIPPPEQGLDELRERRRELQEKIASINDRLDRYAAAGLPAVEAALRSAERSTQLIQVVESTKQEAEGAVMLLEGFAPARREEEVARFCDERDIPFLVEKPIPEDSPPILLKNTGFSRLFEPVGRLFALPNYWELDLTPYFAPFFMLFFGFCLGDAGYGLLLLVVATIYKRRAAVKMKPILALAQFLGAATILFGIITGTFFGMNLLEDQYAFLGRARDFMLDSDQTFNLALILGMVQILFGLVIKGLNQFRQYGFAYAVATLGWIVLLLSLLDLAMLGLTGPAATYGAWAGVALILLFNDPRAGLFGRLGKGIWELYGITGIFGDLLSYIRLFALGISSAILGFVVNDIALQIRDSIAIIGPIFFILFLVVGHGLNLLIASLGAFVHPLRLTFVEFYKNAGFTGGGKPYEPFATEEKKTGVPET